MWPLLKILHSNTHTFLTQEILLNDGSSKFRFFANSKIRVLNILATIME